MKFRSTLHKVEVAAGPSSGQTAVRPLAAGANAPAFRLKKILVPVEFSDCSKKALGCAVALARQFEAQLVLLHVVEPYPPVPQMDRVDVESIHEATGKLETLRSTLAEVVASKAVLRTGDPHTEIINLANELGIDLIILSTHGRSRLAHLLLGNTAEKVTRRATCPILIVPEHEHHVVEGATGQ